MPTILVIDDEPVLRNLIALYLKAAGHSVLEAASAREAIELSFEHSLDLGIVDQELGEAKGVDVANAIVSNHPAMSVILMSGYPQDEARLKRQLAATNVGFLDKPFSLVSLLAGVDKILNDGQKGMAVGSA